MPAGRSAAFHTDSQADTHAVGRENRSDLYHYTEPSLLSLCKLTCHVYTSPIDCFKQIPFQLSLLKHKGVM